MRDRFLNIDILRVIAVVFVLIIHLLSNTNSWIFSYSRIIDQTYFVFSSVSLISLLETAIPLFLIISGYCNVKKILFEKKRVLKNFFKIYIPYIICCSIYLMTNCIVRDFTSLKEYVYLVTSFDLPYMWYLGAYLLLLLLMPFLNRFFINLRQKEQKFILIVLFVFIVLPETLNGYNGKILSDYYVQGLDFIFYYFIGCYLHNVDYSKKSLCILNLITLLIFLSYYFTLPLTQSLAISRNHFVVFMLTITIFLDIFEIFKKYKANKIISLIAQKSLLIYMLSWNFERLFYHFFGVDVLYFNFIRCFIFICVEFVVIFCFSLIFDFVLKKLEDKICMII